MTAPLCFMCDGPRDVRPRCIGGVDLDVCAHCWHGFGPGRTHRVEHTDSVAEMFERGFEPTPAELANEAVRAKRLEADRTRYGKRR